MVAAEAAGSSQSVHDPGLVIAAGLRLGAHLKTSASWDLRPDPLRNTSQSVTSDLARARDNIYIMNNRLDLAFITKSRFVLCKAKNYDPSYAWGSTVHWSTWDLRQGVWPASAVWRARCVTVICKTNRQKLEQIIRYPARASYNTFTRKQMTNLQLTTGRSRSQSADHLPASENLENRSCKQLRWWIVWLFLLVQFFSPAQLMQNLLACKFVGNSVLVFSEMRAMESWYINSVCINNIPLPRSLPGLTSGSAASQLASQHPAQEDRPGAK